MNWTVGWRRCCHGKLLGRGRLVGGVAVTVIMTVGMGGHWGGEQARDVGHA